MNEKELEELIINTLKKQMECFIKCAYDNRIKDDKVLSILRELIEAGEKL